MCLNEESFPRKEFWELIKKISKYVCYSIPTVLCFSIKTIFAFCLLALFLFTLEFINEKWYESLTYWANQKSAPKIESCHFELLPPSPYQTDNKYDYYNVIIKTEIKNQIGSVLISPKIENMTLIEDQDPSKTIYEQAPIPYKIFWKKNLTNNLPKITVRTQKEFIDYKKEKDFNEYNCPLQVEIMYAK